MIEELRIRDLGVIADTTLPLHPGLNVLTGETGAGKTMVVTALGLLLGSRADPGLVRRGARAAAVDGLLRVAPDGGAARLAVEAGGELDDDALLLARSVPADGRARAWAGGRAVPVSVLGAVTEQEVTVHGQSDQLRLRSTTHQRALLDTYAGADHGDLLEAYRGAYDEHRRLAAELTTIEAQARERAQEAQMLRLALAEYDRVAPLDGEDARLDEEWERLAHADELQHAGHDALEAVAGDDEGSTPGAQGLLAAARTALEAVRGHDPRAAELADRLAELTYLTTDLGTDLAGYAASIDADPARLADVDARRADLAPLLRSHGDLPAAAQWSERSRRRLDELDDDGLPQRLRAQVQDALARRDALAGEVSGSRRDAAARLSAAVTTELASLALARARVEVEVAPAEPGPDGADDVVFLLAPTPAPSPGRWPVRPRAASCRASCSPWRSSPRPTPPWGRTSSTRWTPASAARPRWRSAGGSRASPGAGRSSSSPTCPRSRPSPTTTSSSPRPTTARARCPTSSPSTARRGCRRSPGCSRGSARRARRPRTPRSSWTPRPRCGTTRRPPRPPEGGPGRSGPSPPRRTRRRWLPSSGHRPSPTPLPGRAVPEDPARSPPVTTPPTAPPCPRVVVVLSSPTKTVRVHVRGLVTRLLAAGVDVRLASSRAVLATFADLLDVDAAGTVLPLGEDLRPAHDLAAATTLRRALHQHGTEVVHAHGFRAGAIAALAVRLMRRRPALVTTWHSMPYPGPSPWMTVGAGERLVARSSDVTLAPSADLLGRARGVGAHRARLSPVAAPAVQAPQGDRATLRAALAADLGISADAPWILTVGRIVPEKNHDLLLDAATRWAGLHPTPEVLVVGVGSAPVVTRLRRAIADGGLPVRLLGARDDIGALMHAADVFVLTSRWEAPALSVQEAMRAHLPVVSTAVGGVPDVLGDTGVLVPPDDVETFAVEVALLLSDPVRAQQLAEAAAARARSMPDEDDVAVDVLAAYREAAAARPTGSRRRSPGPPG